MSSGEATAALLTLTLSAPDPEQAPGVFEASHPAADGQRNEHLLGGASDDIDHGVPAVRRGGDVVENQLVGPFAVVAGGQLNRVAGIAEVLELHPLDHPTGIDVEAGNDPHGSHARAARAAHSSRAAARSSRPS